MSKPTLRIVLADDHELVRNGIRGFLETYPDIDIVGEASDAVSAVALCEREHPDVALVDLVMPGGGVEAIRAIRATSANTQVVLLTSFEDQQQIVAAVQAGALSCLLKDVDADALVDALRRAALGIAVLHPRIAGYLMDAVRTPQATPTALEAVDLLSQREREALNLMAEGMSNQQIADRLGIAEKTVKSHVSNVLSKLGVSDRTQAAVFAWRSGIKQSEFRVQIPDQRLK